MAGYSPANHLLMGNMTCSRKNITINLPNLGGYIPLQFIRCFTPFVGLLCFTEKDIGLFFSVPASITRVGFKVRLLRERIRPDFHPSHINMHEFIAGLFKHG
ncbi:MAG: hypothetical protein ACOCXV_02950 [Bacteroidota bacterium]